MYDRVCSSDTITIETRHDPSSNLYFACCKDINVRTPARPHDVAHSSSSSSFFFYCGGGALGLNGKSVADAMLNGQHLPPGPPQLRESTFTGTGFQA